MIRPCRLRGLLLSLVLTAFSTFLSIPMATAQDKQEPKVPKDKVIVAIDYADGVEKHFTAIPWQKGMTVLAALQAAQAHPHGIKFEYRGEAETALLTKIDDLANAGADRYWLYRVNGKLANKSFGVYELAAGDVVLWKFEASR